jgi:hypothetical protein
MCSEPRPRAKHRDTIHAERYPEFRRELAQPAFDPARPTGLLLEPNELPEGLPLGGALVGREVTNATNRI